MFTGSGECGGLGRAEGRDREGMQSGERRIKRPGVMAASGGGSGEGREVGDGGESGGWKDISVVARERERERDRERERERKKERERESERVSEGKRESVCVCERERE